MTPAPGGALTFARNVVTLLDQGSFTSTYKFALIVALIELAREQATPPGIPPETLTTTSISEKMVELYWHQTGLHPVGDPPKPVRLKHIAGDAEPAMFSELRTLRQHNSG